MPVATKHPVRLVAKNRKNPADIVANVTVPDRIVVRRNENVSTNDHVDRAAKVAVAVAIVAVMLTIDTNHVNIADVEIDRHLMIVPAAPAMVVTNVTNIREKKVVVIAIDGHGLGHATGIVAIEDDDVALFDYLPSFFSSLFFRILLSQEIDEKKNIKETH